MEKSEHFKIEPRALPIETEDALVARRIRLFGR